jgi:hypothetical protein
MINFLLKEFVDGNFEWNFYTFVVDVTRGEGLEGGVRG